MILNVSTYMFVIIVLHFRSPLYSHSISTVYWYNCGIGYCYSYSGGDNNYYYYYNDYHWMSSHERYVK